MAENDFIEFCKEIHHCRDGYHLDLNYIIKDGKPHKVVFLCPGGGYGFIASHKEGRPFAEFLNANGISAIVVYYRCDKLAIYPNPFDDMAEAVKFAFDHKDELNLDMDNYSICGSSAGGHVAGCFGTKKLGYEHYNLLKPGCLFLVYPVVSMGKYAHANSKRFLLGRNPSQELIDLCSLEKQVDPDYPKTFLWVGDCDKCVNPINSDLLDEALTNANVKHIYNKYSKAAHGIGLGNGTSAANWILEAINFWLNN